MREICDQSEMEFFFLDKSKIAISSIPIGNQCFSDDGMQRVKLRCDERFTHAFTACECVFKEITLVGSNQGNYFENATALHTVNAC